MEIPEMVKALSRLMNPGEPNPAFSAINSKGYVNTVGKGLSRFYFLTAKKNLVEKLTLSSEKGQESYGRLVAKLLFNEHTKPSTALAAIEKMYDSMEEIDFSKMEGSPEDKAAATELTKRVKSGDRLATAAVWVPTLFYWYGLTGGDPFRALFTIKNLLVKYLKFEEKINRGEVSIEEMREWGKAELASFLPIKDGFLHVVFDFGKKFDEKRVGWSSSPSEKDISSVPYSERKRQWEQLRDLYALDTKRAIDLVVRFRKVSVGESFFRALPTEFVTSNQEWITQFVADVKALPTMSVIWDFAKELTSPNIFEPRVRFDGEKIFSYIENVIKMAAEMPEQYAKYAADAIYNLCDFLKDVYQLKDID